MRMDNEIPKEVFGRKQQEVEKRIAELEQQMMQYREVKPATDEDMDGKLEDLRRLMGQFTMPEDGEFTESEIQQVCGDGGEDLYLRTKEKAGVPCSARHFLIKYSYECCHNGRRLVLLRRDCDPPIT